IMYCFSSLAEFATLRESIKQELILSLGEEALHLFVAINEAVNNAIFHGNHEDSGKKVYLTIVKKPHEISIIIRDEGEGYLHKEISASTDLCDEHGRGLCIIKHYLDCYKLNAAGNEITLVKKINAAAWL
ncbi:MAG TPA: ATP-binding protein, partial [Negativicutes bacterium]